MCIPSPYVEENEEIPCDLVLLYSSDPHGHCYIQTSNIDGEANLKLRKVPVVLKELLQADSRDQIQKNLNSAEISIDCGNPDAHIYRFDGKYALTGKVMIRMTLNGNQEIGLSSTNLLLQVTHLQNTKYMFHSYYSYDL